MKKTPKKKKIFVTDNQHLLDNLGSSKITKRVNPFSSSGFKTLSELMEFEEKGSLKIKNIDNDKVAMVTEVLDSLPDMESELIKLTFFQGMSIDEIAAKTNITRSKLYSIRTKAMDRFKVEIEKKLGKKVEHIFKDCVVCNHNNSEEINKFVLKWLEENNWYFRGIIKAIKSEFDLKIPSLPLLISHIKFHLNIDKKKVFDKLSLKYKSDIAGFKEDDIEGQKVNLNIPVSLAVKNKIEKLASDYGRNTSEITRMLIRLSLKPLETILAAQNELFDEAMEVSKDLYKIKNLKDIEF